MTDFIDTKDGHINLAAVIRIIDRHPKDEPPYSEIHYMEGGQFLRAKTHRDLHMFEYGGQVTPAYPGFYVVGVYEDDGGGIWREAVIAWKITGSNVWPITVDGVKDDGQEFGVLSPDGKVTVPALATYNSVEDYIKGTLEDRKNRAEAFANAMLAKASTPSPVPPPAPAIPPLPSPPK